MSEPTDPAFAGLLRWFEQLTPGNLALLESLYAPRARFRDPFNDVTGIEPIRRIFEHMFESLETPRFVIRSHALNGRDGFCTWVFEGRLRGRDFSLLGSTHFVFDTHGRVTLHQDYWDAAEQVYEQVPLLGALLRRLRRRFSAG